MPLSKLGHAVIINNVASEMPGSNEDVKVLKEAYQIVGFEVQVHEKLYCTGMKLHCILQFSIPLQAKIQDFVKGGGGGPQLLRQNVADVAKQSHMSKVSHMRLGSRACLRDLEAFGFLILKYAFSHILETLFFRCN